MCITLCGNVLVSKRRPLHNAQGLSQNYKCLFLVSDRTICSEVVLVVENVNKMVAPPSRSWTCLPGENIKDFSRHHKGLVFSLISELTKYLTNAEKIDSTNLASVTEVKGFAAKNSCSSRVWRMDRIRSSTMWFSITHSRLSTKLAKKLKLRGMQAWMVVSGINSQESLNSLKISVKLKSTDPTNDERCLVERYLKEDYHVGSDVWLMLFGLTICIHISNHWSCSATAMPKWRYFSRHPTSRVTNSNNAPVAVRLLLGLVLSEPLSSNCLSSTCMRANLENVMLAYKVKRWYGIELFIAYKSVDFRSKTDNRPFDFSNKQLSTTVNVTKWECYGLKIFANFWTTTLCSTAA